MSKKGKENTDDILDESASDVNGDTVAESMAGKTQQTGTGGSEILERQVEEQRDKYLRLAAEFDNFRKRTAREILEIRQTASRDLVSSLLEILDDLDRAEKQINEHDEKNELLEGVMLIFGKFRRILEQKGLKAIDTMYTDFDVEKDEAVSEMPVDDEKLKGKVVAEVQKGYMLNDKLIRYAKVVVGR